MPFSTRFSNGVTSVTFSTILAKQPNVLLSLRLCAPYELLASRPCIVTVDLKHSRRNRSARRITRVARLATFSTRRGCADFRLLVSCRAPPAAARSYALAPTSATLNWAANDAATALAHASTRLPAESTSRGTSKA